MFAAMFGASSVVSVAVLVWSAMATPGSHRGPGTPAGRTVEVARIRAHFDSVLSELPAHRTAHLSASQRGERARLLATLRAYRDAGAFPHNYDFPDAPTPYFVDRKTGVLCAVAHLLEASGRRDIVDRVAAMDNNVWVPALAGDTAFTGWLNRSGLTLDEAARIQVPYMGGGPNPDVNGVVKGPPAYSVGSAIALGGALASSAWMTLGNADGHRKWSNVAGVVSSVVSLGVGLGAATDARAPRAFAPVTLAASGLTGWLATRGMLRHSRYSAAKRTARASGLTNPTLSPILPVPGGSGAGLSVRMTF